MKKRRNRLISIALSIGLCAGLAACSGNSGSSDSGKKEDERPKLQSGSESRWKHR